MSLRPTLLQYAAAWSQLAPPLIAVAGGRLATLARRWTIVWCLSLVVHEAAAVVASLRWGSNMWVGYVFRPLTGAVVLWMLSLWQTGNTARLALRAAIPLFMLLSVVLTLTVEDANTFSRFVGPYHALVLVLAAAWTFVARSLSESGPLARQDWFWAVGGVLLYYGTYTALQPVAAFLLASDREDLVHAAFNLKAAMDVLAFAAVTGALFCPVPPTSSGGSSSPPSSPSPSSSPPSARPW
jgi:hypothetical protein